MELPPPPEPPPLPSRSPYSSEDAEEEDIRRPVVVVAAMNTTNNINNAVMCFAILVRNESNEARPSMYAMLWMDSEYYLYCHRFIRSNGLQGGSGSCQQIISIPPFNYWHACQKLSPSLPSIFDVELSQISDFPMLFIAPTILPRSFLQIIFLLFQLQSQWPSYHFMFPYPFNFHIYFILNFELRAKSKFMLWGPNHIQLEAWSNKCGRVNFELRAKSKFVFSSKATYKVKPSPYWCGQAKCWA